jgi:hypothetical protein
MKIQTKTIESQSNMVFDDSTRMSIDPSSIPHIVRVLTELYSDPAQSIVREYAANGLDSHIMAGQTKPVEITFPTYLSPSFVVRDFGIGMSRQEMQTVYSKYGASTKRETNDQIGAFGLGAKSALALVASFTVVSVKDGKRNTVVIAKDEDGVASLNFLDEDTTDEPNGVVVKVPVTNVNDFDRVRRLNIFLGWTPGTVLVDGKQPASIHDTESFSKLGEDGWFSVAPETIGHRGGIRVMVGPVMYEVAYNTASEIFRDTLNGWHFATIAQRLVLNVENGSVALTPSREELIFNRMTKDTLREVAARAIPQVFGKILKQIDEAPDRRDALRRASEVAAFVRPTETVALTWQGQAFHTATKNTGFFAKTDWLDAQRVESEETSIIDSLSMRYKSRGAMSASPLHTQEELVVAGVDFDRYVIITDAERKENGGYTVASYISTWFRNEVKRRDGRIFITTLPAEELNENFVAMANKVIKAADVRKIVLESRRKPAGYKATPRTAGEPKVLTVALMKAKRFYNEKNTLVSTPVADLNQESTYVIVQASADRVAATAIPFENAVYSHFRNSSATSFEQDKAVEAFIELIGQRNLRLIVLPATANRKEVETAIANTTTAHAVLAEVFQSHTPTEAERDFIAFLGEERGRGWHRFNAEVLFENGEAALINQVANETTREFLTLLRAKPGAHAESLLAAASLAKRLKGIVVEESLTESIKAFRKMHKTQVARRYPLLQATITADTARDAVDYINMVDARSN